MPDLLAFFSLHCIVSPGEPLLQDQSDGSSTSSTSEQGFNVDAVQTSSEQGRQSETTPSPNVMIAGDRQSMARAQYLVQYLIQKGHYFPALEVWNRHSAG